VKLMLKFNLVLLLVFAIGFMGTAYFCNSLLQKNAKAEILENARIMVEAALAVRAYTVTEIKPLLDTQIKYVFRPQSVSAYAANSYFKKLQKKFPEYSYREAALNPTNPADRAADWEADIFREFQRSPETPEIVIERETPNGKYLVLARPMRVTDEGCLRCHSAVEIAPATMLAIYGEANGFGWKMGDLIAAQIVSVPTQLPRQRAHGVFVTFMTSVGVIFVVLLLAVNALLYFSVIRPVNRLSESASKVSLGQLDASDFRVSGQDEIAGLSHSFARMKKSLVEAMNMLATQSGNAEK
jgi:HAMP domain-containing protein